MDDGPQRGRGAHARVQPHQAAQSAVQRPAPRRQELPVPRRDRGRRLAAGVGDAGSEAQGHPLLRSVRARLRDPRHARSAVAELSDPDVQPGEVQPARAARPSVPAVPHREVLRAVRRGDRSGGVPPAGRRTLRVPRRRHRRHRQAPRGRDARLGERLGVRAGGAPARPAHGGSQGHREAADGRRSQRGHRRDRHRRGRTRSGGPGLLRPQGSCARPQGVHPRQGGGPVTRAV